MVKASDNESPLGHAWDATAATWVIALGPQREFPWRLAAAMRTAGWRWFTPDTFATLTTTSPPQRIIVLLAVVKFDSVIFTVLRRLADRLAIPVIVFSPVEDAPTAITSLRAGADDYIRTPCTSEEAMARIAAVLRGRYRSEIDALARHRAQLIGNQHG